MTPTPPESDELRALIDALCEESITPEQLRRLEDLILASPEAEAYYVRYMGFYAELSRHFADTRGRGEPVVPGPGRRPPRPARRRLLAWSAVGLAGLAAGLVLVVGVWRPGPPAVTDATIPEAVDDTVAVLLQTHRAVWEDTGLPTRPGSPLPPGRLVLKAGHAHIEFYSGATVILEGPAEFELLSRTRAYCARGKLRATVPAPAQGFAIGSPTLDLIDRGTEFGMDVGGNGTEVHVFQGKVDVYDPAAAATAPPRRELTTGQGVSVAGPGAAAAITPNPAAFRTADELAAQAARETLRRQEEWVESSRARRGDPDLVVYYPFGADLPGTSRTLRDEAAGRRPPRDGAVVGCSWAAGRWRGKQGLEFKRVSDRVRLHVPGDFAALTLAAWVRPDALPNQNNSLFMADGWDDGEVHWQIGSDGTVILGVKAPPEFDGGPGYRGAHYRAYGVVTPERFGRWVHLAVVYDPAVGAVTHYVDGRPAAEAPIQFDTPLRVGDAELGNWNSSTYRIQTPIRNFNGCIDEFLLSSRALPAEEVERLYAVGRPPQ